MTKKVYALLDTKSGVFTPPIPAISDAVIKRTVALDVASGQQTPLNLFPADFLIYRLAEFDDESGEFSNQCRVFVSSALDAFNEAKAQYEAFKKIQLKNENRDKVSSGNTSGNDSLDSVKAEK